MQINLSLASDFLRHKLDDQTKTWLFMAPAEMGLLETIFAAVNELRRNVQQAIMLFARL